MRSNNEPQEVSRGHSTGGKKPGRAEQSLVLSRFRKEVNMKNAEYQGNLSCPQRDSAEHEGYAGAQSVGGQEGKRPKTRAKSLIQLGIPEWQAWAVSNCRKAYWHLAKNGHVQRAISTERLVQAGYYSILDRYESLHLCD